MADKSEIIARIVATARRIDFYPAAAELNQLESELAELDATE